MFLALEKMFGVVGHSLVIVLITSTPLRHFPSVGIPICDLPVRHRHCIDSLKLRSLQLPDPNKNCREKETEKKMILTGIEDEDKWLAEGIAGIQHNAFYMHRALVID